MKKYFILVIISTLIILCGCDEGLLIVDMEIEKYPDKICYFMGIDNKIDLTGGKIKYYFKEDTYEIRDMNDEIVLSVEVVHNVDFNKAGVYVVKLKRNEHAIVEYPIQVVDLEKVNR